MLGMSAIRARPDSSHSVTKPPIKKPSNNGSFILRSLHDYKNSISPLSNNNTSLSKYNTEVSDKKKSSNEEGINNKLVQWIGSDDVDPCLRNKFDSQKLQLIEAVANLHERMAIGRQKEQKDCLFSQHKGNMQTFTEISSIIEGELTRVYPYLPNDLV